MKLNLSYRYRSQLFDFLYVQIEQYGAFAFDSLTMDDADRLLETACEIAEVTAEEFEVTDLVIGLIGWSVLLEGASTGYEDLEHAIEPILQSFEVYLDKHQVALQQEMLRKNFPVTILHLCHKHHGDLKAKLKAQLH